MHDFTGDLGQLKPAPGAIKKTKRIGRGRGSGMGDTATKGHKGQKSRSGYKATPGFEGGQMPLKRRIPKRGFRIYGRTEYREINVKDLDRIEVEEINPDVLRASKIVKGKGPIVLLGEGEINRAVKIRIHRITKSAEEKIKAAGGTIEILTLDPIDRRVKKGPKPKEKRKKDTKSGS